MTGHGILYASPIANGNGIEIVCTCGAHRSAYGQLGMTYGGLLAEHMADVQTRQVDAMLARKALRYDRGAAS